MGCCVGEKHNNWCQDNPTGPSYPIRYIDKEGNKYCIFHAPADCKFVELYDEREEKEKPPLMDGYDFNQLVFERIQGVLDAGEDKERDKWNFYRWNPRCNFAGTIFPDDISFSDFNSENGKYLPPINFQESQFRGFAYFRESQFRMKACFTKSQFRKTADFTASQFKGYADFSESQFWGDALFLVLQFQMDADFTASQFRGIVSFRESQFRGKADFGVSQFLGGSDFQKTQFLGNAFFTKSKFREIALFSASQFWEATFFSESQFRGDADFGKSQFRGYADFKKSQFRGVAIFRKSQFRGGAYFRESLFLNSYTFTGTQFRKETFFSNSLFCHSGTFSSCQFRENANFEHCDFLRACSFNQTQFREDADFTGCGFHKADFKRAESRKQLLLKDAAIEKANFDQMEFKGPTHLDGAFFFGRTTFTNAIFHEYSNFEKTRFYGPVSFRHALFKEWTYFRNVKFLAPTSFAGTISKETILIEAVNLFHLSLSETNIESFQFTECTWPKGRNGHRIIRDEAVKLECKEKRKSAELEKIYRQLEEIYRRLKKVARENNDEMRASTWHYKEKEMLRKRLRAKNGPGVIEKFYSKVCNYLPCRIDNFQQKITGLVASTERQSTPFIRFLNTAYWLVSGYGEEPLRAGAWLLVFIFGAMAAAFFGPDAAPAAQTPAVAAQLPAAAGAAGEFIKSWLWYMPLLKIDGLQPTGWNELFRALFNVAISVQAALFGFALRNKLRR